jgi:hypothetical protein
MLKWASNTLLYFSYNQTRVETSFNMLDKNINLSNSLPIFDGHINYV